MVRFRTAAVAPAALLALAASAHAAFTVQFDFNLSKLNFNGSAAHNLFPGVSVFGFTDEFDPGNAAFLRSPTSAFEAGPGFTSSVNFGTAQDLLNEVNAGNWTLEIFDGVTGVTSEYTFSIFADAMLASPQYWRTTTVTSLLSGETIAQTPTFEWSIEPNLVGDPMGEFDFIGAQLVGAVYELDIIAPTETSWTPASSPLAPGSVVDFYVQYQNSANPPSDLLQFPFTLDPLNGAEELESFGGSIALTSVAIVTDLTVIPAPGTMALAGLAGLVAVGRRR